MKIRTEKELGEALKKGQEQIDKARKLEEKPLPSDIDYTSIKGLRIEAQQKLNKIR